MAIRVGVSGATGRLGRAVCAAVAADPRVDLVAAVGRRGGEVQGVTVARGVADLEPGGLDVMVDVSAPDGARTVVPWCAEHGVHAVVGTTGLGDADLESWRAAFTRSNCLVAPNFAIGAVL